MLRAGIGTGYAIKRAVDQSTRFFWSTSFAQVYPELARLEKQEYIVGHDDPLGDRPRLSPTGTRVSDWCVRRRPHLASPETNRVMGTARTYDVFRYAAIVPAT